MVFKKSNNAVEKKVLDMLLDHARVVYNGTELLGNIVDNWKTPGRTKFNINVSKLDALEAKANTIKKSALKEITDAGPVLLFRQDLVRIVRTTDQIIDLAQGAAFFLTQLNDDWIPPINICDNVEELIDKALYVTKNLVDLVRALFQSLDRIIELAETIEITENKADTNYRTLIIELAKLKTPKGVDVLVREACDRIEDMIDKARDVASYLQIYSMSR